MKNIKRFLALLLVMVSIGAIFLQAAPVAKAELIDDAAYIAKYLLFIQDSRWKHGSTWDINQTPKLSKYSSSGCCAYAADFVAYVYGSTKLAWDCSDFTRYTNLNDIRAGDVIHISGHWFVVLQRTGNNFYTAEGSFESKVRICEDGWGIKDGKIYNLKAKDGARTFVEGYHYKGSGSGSSTSSFTFSDLPDKVSYSDNDAVIAQRLNKPKGTTASKYGAKLYDKGGNLLGSVSDTSSGLTNSTYIDMWWTVSTGLKVKLWPGQTYQYEFWATVDGTTYTSPRRTFNTTGTAPTITLNYNANGGTGSMSATKVALGGTTKLRTNTFTKPGYSFAGWHVLRGDGRWIVVGNKWLKENEFTSSDTKRVFSDGLDIYMAYAWYVDQNQLYDYTFYAVWELNPDAAIYTLSYNTNGGTGSFSNQTVKLGDEFYILATIPTRAGYTFQGWYALRTGDNTWYCGEAGWKTDAEITASGYQKKFYRNENGVYLFNNGWVTGCETTPGYTFYAVWQPNTYTISYNANGGSGAPGSQTKTHDQTLTLSTTKPTRTGYTFQGWATSATATTATYQPGGSFTGNANTTLYAVWKANTYTLTYDANGGSGAPGSQTKTYGQTLTLSTTKPTRTGYTFQGWATSASATSAAYQPGGSFTGNANTTLYAVWEKNPVTNNCETNGHSYKVTFTAPSCEEKGYSTYTCTVCGHSYQADEVAAFGHHYSNGTCTTCGKINTTFTGIANRDGALYYIQDDKIATDVTGLIKYDGIWYYVKSGKVASETTDLVKYNGEWFYVVKGKVASGMTDLVNWGGEWFYVVKGKLAANTTTLIKWNGVWYYIYKGKLAGNTTNLIKYNGEWWYVIKGRVASEITDLVKYNGEWFYVVKGKIASNTTKLVEFNGGWYYIYKGKLAAKTTTLVKHNGSWYYVVNGKVNFNYNGKVLYSGTYYKVKNGKVV